jgi:hypothetical protein
MRKRPPERACLAVNGLHGHWCGLFVDGKDRFGQRQDKKAPARGKARKENAFTDY